MELGGLSNVQMWEPTRNGGFPAANFDKIGKRMLEIVTGDYIKEKYKIEDGIKIKNKLREERIKYLKEVL